MYLIYQSVFCYNNFDSIKSFIYVIYLVSLSFYSRFTRVRGIRCELCTRLSITRRHCCTSYTRTCRPGEQHLELVGTKQRISVLYHSTEPDGNGSHHTVAGSIPRSNLWGLKRKYCTKNE